jgi:Xaa-Pro aminopeptidase
VEERHGELAIKRQRLEELRSKLGLDAILLRRTSNIAWASAGARFHIAVSEETGVGALLYDADGFHLLTNNIEEQRLLAEELPPGDWHAESRPWFGDWLNESLRSRGISRLGADVPIAGAQTCATELALLRVPLLPPEIDRFRSLGRETGTALEAAARAVRRGDSEFEIASRISAELIARGIDPVVLVVAADRRVAEIRHPLPTHARVSERAMLVTCGRRDGLIASATRLVQLGHVPAELARRQEACARVDAAFIAATREGATAAEIFNAGAAAYAAEGFDGEWKLHHQGGAAGYETRDWFGTPTGDQVVTTPQAFAWNPSITGTKVEDTVLVTPSGVEVLTATGDWPTVTVSAGGLTLERPTILELG